MSEFLNIADRQWVVKQIDQLLRDKGADYNPGKCGEFGYDYTIHTEAGLLHIRLGEDHGTKIVDVMGRFDNPDKAKDMLHGFWADQLNSYSGKWNFHYLYETKEEMVRHYTTGLELLWNHEPYDTRFARTLVRIRKITKSKIGVRVISRRTFTVVEIPSKQIPQELLQDLVIDDYLVARVNTGVEADSDLRFIAWESAPGNPRLNPWTKPSWINW